MKANGHRRSVAHRFTAAAETYDGHAAVQQTVARALLEEAPALPPDARILEGGCGTGQLTALLAGQYPSARIDAFDASPRMLEVARRRLGSNSRVHCFHDTFEDLQVTGAYHLVISSAALHWVQTLAPAVQALAHRTGAGGHLRAALMMQGTLRELHEARARVAPKKQPRVRLPDPESIRETFRLNGFLEPDCTKRTLVEHHASAPSLLRALRAAGLTGGTGVPPATLLVRRELEALAADYEAHYRDGDGVRATYEVMFITTTRRR